MLKHIGRHGDRKVAIVFREIPNEEHMCLVIYPDVLPTHIHNSVMSVLESAPGQQSSNLADVFHRNLLPDGRNILQTLHHEGMLKKIATNQVILTPTATSSVKLDEINKLVKEMESGTEALKRMQEIDNSAGMVSPEVKRQAEAEFKNRQQGHVAPIRTGNRLAEVVNPKLGSAFAPWVLPQSSSGSTRADQRYLAPPSQAPES